MHNKYNKNTVFKDLFDINTFIFKNIANFLNNG